MNFVYYANPTCSIPEVETKHTRYNRSEKGRARNRRYDGSEAGKTRKRAYQTEGLGGFLKKRRWALRSRRKKVIEMLEELSGKDS